MEQVVQERSSQRNNTVNLFCLFPIVETFRNWLHSLDYRPSPTFTHFYVAMEDALRVQGTLENIIKSPEQLIFADLHMSSSYTMNETSSEDEPNEGKKPKFDEELFI